MSARLECLRTTLAEVEAANGRLTTGLLGAVIVLAHGRSPEGLRAWIGIGDDGSDEFSLRDQDDWSWGDSRHLCPDVSVDGARRLIEAALPGWCWKAGTCHVSDDAWVCPDWNDPAHADRLKEQFGGPVHGTPWGHGFDVDRRPPGNVPLALIEALLLALIAIEERTPSLRPAIGESACRGEG